MPACPLTGVIEETAGKMWLVFLEAARAGGISLASLPTVVRECAPRMFVFSKFLAEGCSRHPELFLDLVESGDLTGSYPPGTFISRLDALLTDIDEESRLEALLRRFRRREMLRIAWRDLAAWADLFETMADLTRLADAVIDRTTAVLYRRLCAACGTPRDANGERQHLVVVGLGKLGGEELNFSSDVDLIFAYPHSGETVGIPKPMANEEFFLRLCRSLIKVLSQPSPEGIVFRVDTRLRPFGDNGPLVMSFDGMEHYYQDQGREWERYAWIKARVVAGDKSAGKRLLERLNPFIFRRYLDYGAFESLRDMKQRVSLEVARRSMQDNIKLGRGGIREIEFFGQVFQLIRGGIDASLQERSILKVLKMLGAGRIVPERACKELRAAYEFLRTLEHRLQEYEDKQTHQLPKEPSAALRLACSMGFETEQAFWEELERHRGAVHQQFALLLEPTEEQEAGGSPEKSLSGVWLGLLETERSEALLDAAGFSPASSALRLLEHLRSDPVLRHLGKEGRRRLDKLLPRLLRAAGASPAPLITLHRITDLLRAIEGRASYLSLLLENPGCLDHLVRLSSASSLIAALLARHPVLLDELLDSRTLYSPPDRFELETELSERMARLNDDFEFQMEALRVFKQVNVLRVAAADVTEALPLMRVSDHLSYIAEVLVEQVLELAWNHLTARHGIPACVADTDDGASDRGFAVVAYGKLGGLELGYGSDLDLVFLHDAADGRSRGADQPLDDSQFFARLGQRMLHILSVPTRAGVLYEVDMRLRPNGGSGVLVSHIDGFRDYQLNSAWTWEHQALLRARPVGGCRRLGERFEAVRREVLSRRRNRRELRRQVVQMRQRMRRELLKSEPGIFDIKQDRGGIVDIEFLVQYLVLLKSCEYPQLLEWTDNVRLINTLLGTGAINELDAHLLRHAYLIYRSVAHKLSLQELPARISDDRFQLMRRRVVEIWNSYLGPADGP
jgi:glutamate-ammonia-ligase adenylyltransferase